jgi:hypothetical protein
LKTGHGLAAKRVSYGSQESETESISHAFPTLAN